MDSTNNMITLGIDPGTTETAYTMYNGEKLLSFGKIANGVFEQWLKALSIDRPDMTFIEGIASYGMPVGASTFETCYFIGRLTLMCELLDMKHRIIYRKDVKMHFCNSMKAKDGNISQALRDRFGEKGTKKNPGFFFGISSDMWSSTAIAIYGHDKLKQNHEPFVSTA